MLPTVQKLTQYRQLLDHVVRIGADTAKPVRFRGEQQINNWSVREFIDNLNSHRLFILNKTIGKTEVSGCFIFFVNFNSYVMKSQRIGYKSGRMNYVNL